MGQIRSQLSLLWQQENQDMHVLMQALSMPVFVCAHWLNILFTSRRAYILMVLLVNYVHVVTRLSRRVHACALCKCVCVCSTAHAHTVTHISSYHFSVLKADPGALLFFFFKNLAATVKV